MTTAMLNNTLSAHQSGGAKASKTSIAIGCIFLPGERWLPVDEDGYYLSNYGRWYSAKSDKLLSTKLNNSGYPRTSIWSRTIHKRKWYLTHIQVVKYFGDCNGNYLPAGDTLLAQGYSIDHIDGNPLNNAQCNLELVTHRENCARRDARQAALHPEFEDELLPY
jgi:hypothetical protein